MKAHTRTPASLFIVAGPCLIESELQMREVARVVATLRDKYKTSMYLKGSFRKANRSSVESFVTIGETTALEILSSVGKEFDLPTLTDIHETSDAAFAAEYADVLQIPAFLARQTDLLTAAAATGKTINVKKGQFMAPEDMDKVVQKIRSVGENEIWLTERGTFFGYHNLVVDMRSLPIMEQTECRVVYDATHSLQRPSVGAESGGDRQYSLPLARAAVAVGCHGIFAETHPDPASAKSDKATQIPLSEFPAYIAQLMHIHNSMQTLPQE